MPRRRNHKDKQAPRTKPRILFIFTPLFLAFALLILRAFDLQFGEQSQLERFMRRVEPSTMTLAENRRGIIFDRSGKELAVNITMKSLYIDPLIFKQQQAYPKKLGKIAKLTKTSYGELRLKLEKAKRFFWVRRHLDPDVAVAVEALDLAGAHFINESKRFYPNGELAANLLGFTNIDSKGIEGVEYAHNSRLSGENAKLRVQRDAKGRVLLVGGIEKRAKAGKNVYLTIDSVLQYVAEREITRAVEQHGAASATAILMDPYNAEVLAIANRPTFNPNRYSRYKASARRNRAITDIYEPGSTFKPFVLGYALDNRLIDKNEQLYCKPGSFTVQRKTIREPGDREWLYPEEILQHSSNIGPAKISMLLGHERVHKMLSNFGFGRKTGIELPGEVLGLIRSHKSWADYDLASCGFGQGFGVTPLQIIRGFTALVNGGFLLKPTILLKVEDAEGNVVESAKRRVLRKTIGVSTSQDIRRMLKSVLTPEGTGARAALANYAAGGKTGTAQRFDVAAKRYLKDDHIVSFVGFLPVDEPQLIVLVVINQPQGKDTSGGSIAAPVFKKIAEQAAEYLNILPDRQQPKIATASAPAARHTTTHASDSVATLSNGESMDMQKQAAAFRGKTMRQVISQAAAAGLNVSVRGSGFATGEVAVDPKSQDRVIVFFKPRGHGRGGRF